MSTDMGVFLTSALGAHTDYHFRLLTRYILLANSAYISLVGSKKLNSFSFWGTFSYH
jgi:hypothetical protein